MVVAGGIAGVGAGSVVADKIVNTSGIVGPSEVAVIGGCSHGEVIGKMSVVVEVRGE